MKRTHTQTEVDEFRRSYLEWERNKFQSGSETSAELARRLGISKSTLYRLREKHWKVDANGDGHEENRDQGDLAPVVRYLTAELAAAITKIAELERLLAQCETGE